MPSLEERLTKLEQVFNLGGIGAPGGGDMIAILERHSKILGSLMQDQYFGNILGGPMRLPFSNLLVGTLTAVGTFGAGGAIQSAGAGNNRIVINAEEIAGYNSADEMQFSIRSSDGVATFGSTPAVIDATGIHFKDTNFSDGVFWDINAYAVRLQGQSEGDHAGFQIIAEGSDEQTSLLIHGNVSASDPQGNVVISAAGGLHILNPQTNKAAKITLWGDSEDPETPSGGIANGSLWYRTDTHKFHMKVNGVTETISAGGAMNAVYKDSDQMVSNYTTFVDDNELVLAVSANKVYFGHVQVIAGSASITPNIKMQFTIPAGAHILWWQGWGDDPSDTETSVLGTDRTNNTFNEGLAAGVDEGINFGIILFVAETAGNLQFQWAQQVSGGVGTYVRAGSYMMLEEGDNAG